MKKYFNLLLSSKATMILLLILGAAMAVATFIEDKYDTVTARSLIYNTTWFELIFAFLIINLFGHLKAYNLFSKKKIGGNMATDWVFKFTIIVKIPSHKFLRSSIRKNE